MPDSSQKPSDRLVEEIVQVRKLSIKSGILATVVMVLITALAFWIVFQPWGFLIKLVLGVVLGTIGSVGTTICVVTLLTELFLRKTELK